MKTEWWHSQLHCILSILAWFPSDADKNLKHEEIDALKKMQRVSGTLKLSSLSFLRVLRQKPRNLFLTSPSDDRITKRPIDNLDIYITLTLYYLPHTLSGAKFCFRHSWGTFLRYILGLFLSLHYQVRMLRISHSTYSMTKHGMLTEPGTTSLSTTGRWDMKVSNF